MVINSKEYLIVHHTGGAGKNPLADTSHHTFEMVNAYHKSLGWGEIGYHYFIEKSGKIRKGRDENRAGAHTLGYNSKSLGICFAGNFDVTLPTQEQINAGRELLSTLREKYSIPLNKIVPHRAFSNKTCCGSQLPDTWARSLVKPLSPKPAILAKIEELKKLVEGL